MSDLFKDWRDFKPQEKKHLVTIQGEVVEVSLQQKLEIMRNGEDDYVLKNGQPVRKDKKITRKKFLELERSIYTHIK